VGEAIFFRKEFVMSREHRVLILSFLVWLVFCHSVAAEEREVRLLFTGDILLSRNVALELAKRKTSPWIAAGALFRHADLVVGNLEGAVGEASDCLPSNPSSPCFSIAEGSIPLLSSAGFIALSVENNHSDDLGQNGRAATIRALERNELVPLSFDLSPRFFPCVRLTVGMIALNLVPGCDGSCASFPWHALRQKLRTARVLANLVVVTVHWGSELLDWPNRTQIDVSEWLIAHGADLVVGHHPHVIQAPEMIRGRPVFFSLGNHLFDQKYPATKEGLIADCRIHQGSLICQGIVTHTARDSFFPEIAEAKHYDLTPAALQDPIRVSGFMIRPVSGNSGAINEMSLEGVSNDGRRMWKTRPIELVSISTGKLDGKNEYLFTLERHFSPIDGEIGLRPHVYSVTPRGLLARWRGSGLAWPLLDAIILPDDGKFLCGLHRGDSYIDLQPESNQVRVAAYRWNGFGFSGVDDPEVREKCRKCLEMRNRNHESGWKRHVTPSERSRE
jgi:hypothetical protein